MIFLLQRQITATDCANAECLNFYSEDFTLIRVNKNILPSSLQMCPIKLYEGQLARARLCSWTIFLDVQDKINGEMAEAI